MFELRVFALRTLSGYVVIGGPYSEIFHARKYFQFSLCKKVSTIFILLKYVMRVKAVLASDYLLFQFKYWFLDSISFGWPLFFLTDITAEA